MTRLIFVTGTDTEVGKTYVAACLARSFVQSGKPIGIYKPVASGCRIEEDDLVSDDAVDLWQAAGRPLTLDQVCPQRFLAPLAPPVAADAEGKTLSSEQLEAGLRCWTDQFETVIVEGAGGFLSPLADGVLNADFAKSINAEILIVAANRLGMINQTLLTVESCRTRLSRDPLAIIVNQISEHSGESSHTNAGQLSHYVKPIIVAELDFGTSDLIDTRWSTVIEPP